MAAPNIVNVQSITGTTAFVANVSNSTPSVILSNAANSNQVYKVNTLIVSNTSASVVGITVKYYNQASAGGSSANIAFSISVPSGSTLSVVGKDTPLYLPENTSIGAIAGVANSADIIVSYEVIS